MAPHDLRGLIPIYLVLARGFASASLSIRGPIMPLYVRSLGIGVAEWGLLAMYNAFGMMIFEWMWGLY